ncbi:MAG: hypothetical protein AAB901_01185 [Patescibacteria group bacterium]
MRTIPLLTLVVFGACGVATNSLAAPPPSFTVDLATYGRYSDESLPEFRTSGHYNFADDDRMIRVGKVVINPSLSTDYHAFARSDVTDGRTALQVEVKAPLNKASTMEFRLTGMYPLKSREETPPSEFGRILPQTYGLPETPKTLVSAKFVMKLGVPH